MTRANAGRRTTSQTAQRRQRQARQRQRQRRHERAGLPMLQRRLLAFQGICDPPNGAPVRLPLLAAARRDGVMRLLPRASPDPAEPRQERQRSQRGVRGQPLRCRRRRRCSPAGAVSTRPPQSQPAAAAVRAAGCAGEGAPVTGAGATRAVQQLVRARTACRAHSARPPAAAAAAADSAAPDSVPSLPCALRQLPARPEPHLTHLCLVGAADAAAGPQLHGQACQAGRQQRMSA